MSGDWGPDKMYLSWTQHLQIIFHFWQVIYTLLSSSSNFVIRGNNSFDKGLWLQLNEMMKVNRIELGM